MGLDFRRVDSIPSPLHPATGSLRTRVLFTRSGESRTLLSFVCAFHVLRMGPSSRLLIRTTITLPCDSPIRNRQIALWGTVRSAWTQSSSTRPPGRREPLHPRRCPGRVPSKAARVEFSMPCTGTLSVQWVSERATVWPRVTIFS